MTVDSVDWAGITAWEAIASSALIRRILARAMRENTEPVLTVERVEQIARRVLREWLT